MDFREKYETIVGLEVHVQLNTNSKAYCSDANLFGQPPNTCISPISMGYPGTLPKINKEVIKNEIIYDYYFLQIQYRMTDYYTYLSPYLK